MLKQDKLRLFSVILITLMIVSIIPVELFYTDNFNQLNNNTTNPNNIKENNGKEIIENKIQADVNISKNSIKKQFNENEIIISINGKKLRADEGQNLLELIKRNQVDIPSPCYLSERSGAPLGAEEQ